MKGIAWFVVVIIIVAIAVAVGCTYLYIVSLFSVTEHATVRDEQAILLSALNLYHAQLQVLRSSAELEAKLLARDLGIRRGGVYELCKVRTWNSSCPSLEELKDYYKRLFVERLAISRELGEAGQIKSREPELVSINLSENCVRASFTPFTIWYEDPKLKFNISSNELIEIESKIRYLLLLEIGQLLVKSGEYKNTNPSFKASIYRLSDKAVSPELNCSAIPRLLVEIENGKVKVNVDNLWWWSSFCGINYSVEERSYVKSGLVDLPDYWEIRQVSSWGAVNCPLSLKLRERMYDVLSLLESVIEVAYNDLDPNFPDPTCSYEVNCSAGYCGIEIFTYVSTEIETHYENLIDSSSPVPKQTSCADYEELCYGECSGESYNASCAETENKTIYNCSIEEGEKGSCGCGIREDFCYYKREVRILDTWQNGSFFHQSNLTSVLINGCTISKESPRCNCVVTSCPQNCSGTDEQTGEPCECNVTSCETDCYSCFVNVNYSDCTTSSCKIEESACTCEYSYEDNYVHNLTSSKRYECERRVNLAGDMDFNVYVWFSIRDKSILIPTRGRAGLTPLYLVIAVKKTDAKLHFPEG